MTRKLVPLVMIFALAVSVICTETVSAQYGAGFTRSPIAIQAYPYGQVVGIIPGGYGYSNGYGYGYGGYNGYSGNGFAISSGPFGTNFSYYNNQPYYGGYRYSNGSYRHHRR